MTKHTVSDSDALRAATNFSLFGRSTARLRPWAATPCPIERDADDPLHEGPAKCRGTRFACPRSANHLWLATTVSCRRLRGGIRPAGRTRAAPTVSDRAGTDLALRLGPSPCAVPRLTAWGGT